MLVYRRVSNGFWGPLFSVFVWWISDGSVDTCLMKVDGSCMVFLLVSDYQFITMDLPVFSVGNRQHSKSSQVPSPLKPAGTSTEHIQGGSKPLVNYRHQIGGKWVIWLIWSIFPSIWRFRGTSSPAKTGSRLGVMGNVSEATGLDVHLVTPKLEK